MPEDAKILSAVNQKQFLCIYALVNPAHRAVDRFFWVTGTGDRLDTNMIMKGKFVDTVIFQDGGFVVHVFDFGERLP
jgi:hypothetical protein